MRCHHRASVQSRLQHKPVLVDFGLQPFVAILCDLVSFNIPLYSGHIYRIMLVP